MLTFNHMARSLHRNCSKLTAMKKSIPFLSLVIIFSFLNPSIYSAQNDTDNNLKLFGEVLGNEKSDITVYQNVDDDWKLIRSLKSRSKYTLELDNNFNHYIVFGRKDGLIKFLYVDQNNSGKMKMNFNITFDDFSTKNIRIYKASNSENYTAEVNKKKYREINMNKLQIDPTIITVK